MTYRLADLPQRIASKIRVNPETGCWEWVNAKPGRYGQLWWEGRNRRSHVVVFELLEGPVPQGRELDHVHERGCRSKACCWPAHLEPVTTSENQLRAAALRAPKTECPQGHPYDEKNTYRRGRRQHCRACKRAWWRSNRGKPRTTES